MGSAGSEPESVDKLANDTFVHLPSPLAISAMLVYKLECQFKYTAARERKKRKDQSVETAAWDVLENRMHSACSVCIVV